MGLFAVNPVCQKFNNCSDERAVNIVHRPAIDLTQVVIVRNRGVRRGGITGVLNSGTEEDLAPILLPRPTKSPDIQSH